MDQKAVGLLSQSEADWDDDLEQLYRRHAPWLSARLRHTFGTALAADADDLVQDTYAKVERRATGLREPRAMLTRIAFNLAKDLIRRRAVRSDYAAAGGASPSSSLSALDACDALIAKDLILSLPEAYRDVFVLSRFHGSTYRESEVEAWKASRGFRALADRTTAAPSPAPAPLNETPVALPAAPSSLEPHSALEPTSGRARVRGRRTRSLPNQLSFDL